MQVLHFNNTKKTDNASDEKSMNERPFLQMLLHEMLN